MRDNSHGKAGYLYKHNPDKAKVRNKIEDRIQMQNEYKKLETDCNYDEHLSHKIKHCKEKTSLGKCYLKFEITISKIRMSELKYYCKLL